MDWIEEFAKKYGGIVIAVLIGAIIRRIRETMTLIQFCQVISEANLTYNGQSN